MKKVAIKTFIVGMFLFFQTYAFGSETNEDYPNVVQHEMISKEHLVDGKPVLHQEHEEDSHGSDMSPLFFIIMALVIGAATRHFLRKSPLPYTVTLLIFGFLIGWAAKHGFFDAWQIGTRTLDLGLFKRSVEWAGNIDPHLILYIFLPTLIFEAAFAMDVHTFRKIFGNATILAIPGIIVALILTAAMVMGIKSTGLSFDGWGWPIALLFGTVICATDPVAVVALLKELGASKKLGTLIEGESLLNDGTAIVIYLVLIDVVIGTVGAGASTLQPVMQFFLVAVGGTLVGGVLGWITIAWVRRVFNDALVEISVVIVAAYLTFYIAEGMHVSGVLGLVALGLIMAGIGRTRISPEVEHFLHEFWELAAFIANTLIFIIVGVVIAGVFSGNVTLYDFLVLGIIYLGIHVVRATVIALFFPVMKRSGYGLTKKDSAILWWGALRGAVGLALALMVAAETRIPQEIRDTFLFHTAGIVMLTLLINATTIKYLVRALGLTRIAPAKALIMMDANNYLRESCVNAIAKIKLDKFMNKAHWKAVEEYIPKPLNNADLPILEISSNIAEIRRRILEKEKSSYWSQFKEGLIGPGAVMRLNDGINAILDSEGELSLSDRQDLEKELETPNVLNKLQRFPLIGTLARKMFFDKLSLSYDVARGFITAQEEALQLVQNMIVSRDPNASVEGEEMKTLKMMEQEINENRIHGLTFIRTIRNTYPEIYKAIATRQAIRSVLNYEKKTIDRLQKKGRLDTGETAKLINDIEERMKKLIDSPPSLAMPKQQDILTDIQWLKDLDDKTFEKVSKAFSTKLFPIDVKLIKQDASCSGIYIIYRGKIKVLLNNEVIEVMGPGSSFGETSILTGSPSAVSIVAESPVTSLFLPIKKAQQLLSSNKTIEENLWNFAGNRLAENLLRKKDPFNKWIQKEFKQWLLHGELKDLEKGSVVKLGDELAIMIAGQVERLNDKREVINSPVRIVDGDIIKSNEAKIFICRKEVQKG